MPLVEAANRSLRAIKTNGHLNAFVSLKTEQKLLTEVSQSNKRILEGKPKSPIDGRLIAVKDNICTIDLKTTCASEMLREYVSPIEATVVQRLRLKGGVIMGKTNMDEFGMGSHSVRTMFGVVSGPGHAEEAPRSAGGSSGGSGAAVAAGMCYAALGTDTGGSVRLPASYCGIVGFKPSYGMVSRWGVVAYANSLDTVGILGTTSSNVKNIYDIINGYDSNDPTCLSSKTRERIQDRLYKYRNPGPLRIGFPLEYNLSELTPGVRSAWKNTLSQLAAQGHRIFPVSLPTTKNALSAYYILAPAEACSNLAKYDGLRYGHREENDRSKSENGEGILFAPTRRSGFGDEVRRRILLGAYTLSSEAIDNYFLKAQSIRRLVQKDFDEVFNVPNLLREDREFEEGQNPNGVDVLIAPSSLSTAPLLEDVLAERSPLNSYVNDVLTVPASLAGIPAISIPVKAEGTNSVESSVGMQIIAQYGDEESLWGVAKAIEAF
ncbi:Trimeric GatFAB AmidoTransferase(AdT) complex subunit [Rhizina undulata]